MEAAAVPTVGLVSDKAVAQRVNQRTVHRRGTSSFEILADGKEAFLARLAAVETAQTSLDFQYFIWADDVTGTVFAARLLAAADRGVKVRILLDITKGAQWEVRSGALASHPNIEVAFFNPMTALKGIFAGNPIPVLGEVDRMQSRMHNKILVADNTLFIGGGRNLADGYFGADSKHNMRDLDFIAKGPVVQDAARSFQLYWDSPLTRKADKTKITDDERDDLDDLRETTSRKKWILSLKKGYPYPKSMTSADAFKLLQELSGRMIWADYEFVADPPERMLRRGKVPSPTWRTKESALAGAQKEVVMHAAYLIPQEEVLELFGQIGRRGVKVSLLTNSLASIDGLIAMSGIANRRRDVLDTGASLYELNARAPVREKYIHSSKMTPLGMHTKGMVVDDRVSFIGSYNMDPRSKYINTETGVIIDSPAFAARLKDYLLEDFDEVNCWHLTCEENGRLCWTGADGVKHYRDPEAPLQKRLSYWLLTHMPWEDLL
ncbi:phospholipase D family protein [Prosthecobacter sp. SYSU 5D2]|uniref:phospholipase D family protein n=1 Tax=Prosthecobacter sp. SYSU 5D2 TaxID=3134134 RepID=UPI0031FE70A5